MRVDGQEDRGTIALFEIGEGEEGRRGFERGGALVEEAGEGKVGVGVWRGVVRGREELRRGFVGEERGRERGGVVGYGGERIGGRGGQGLDVDGCCVGLFGGRNCGNWEGVRAEGEEEGGELHCGGSAD